MNAIEAGSVILRLETLIGRTLRRFKLNSPKPEWDDDELAELGPALKGAVRAKVRQRERAVQRLLTMQARLAWLKREAARDDPNNQNHS